MSLVNKLRRPSPHKAHSANEAHTKESLTIVSHESRTMALARAAAVMTAPSKPLSPVVAVPIPKIVKPVTPAEQYWAARALTAEAILSVKTQHHEEIKMLAVVEETKRTQEVAQVNQMHESRQRRLEAIAIALLTALVGLVAFLLYTPQANRSPARQSRSVHFTIPILSPFASVVEHESSVIGTKILTVIILASAVLAYGCFRFWMAHRLGR
ncbi:uncharacterized protein PHACADRAFT_255085 [Phanerochaete carnosa HHB-10118-sp]|uniref:Uncharacterized protein n=1 Tax=Phanerochaete carnosa (strain HHB-10118-sp) TaxID=650164 RepID=K5V460_PHACS|nr:uncharacterized protein PHACADRAFT_255085 [Phanerochaete carnosa HHB-10118-sp]EKM57366.1 hypothetical protein PHACADRAFT_255085 [Phanerochaete carnosa HHB-10118-sp]